MNNYKLIFTIICFSLVSCKKVVDAGAPKFQLTSTTVFETDASAIAAQLAIYSQMEAAGFPYYLSVYTGLSADELMNYNVSADYVDLSTNNLSKTNGNVYSLWTSLYKYIYEANAIAEGLSKSKAISSAVKQQLLGESKFVRAFCHFYLVNLFGDVPIIQTTDYRINRLAARKPAAEVYQSIISDLKDAQVLLSEDYVNGSNKATSERTRPNKWAATAFLARTYLFAGQWTEAEAEATKVISLGGKYALQANLDNVFLKNNSEAIWQLASVLPGFNSYEGGYFILNSTPSSTSIALDLINSFDTSDKRKKNWIRSIAVAGQIYYYPFKYKVGQNASSVTEYSMMLRLAELYLVRAEARAEINNLGGALDDLNLIRNRAGLPNASAVTIQQLHDAISDERRFEFFAELGHRWFDLKRMNKTNILSTIKSPNWQATDQLYPIPQTEINNDPALTQNPGY